MTERERWEWEREHEPTTIEGQIESAAMFGRGLARHRDRVSRFLLISAIAVGALAIVGLVLSL